MRAMIRNRGESDFPDVDRMIDEAATRPPVVLEYRGVDPGETGEGTWTPLARIVRRAAFAGACAALAGGIGLSIDNRGEGAGLMAIGAGVLGLIVPIPGARRRNAW
jgi:hypothetical protein